MSRNMFRGATHQKKELSNVIRITEKDIKNLGDSIDALGSGNMENLSGVLKSTKDLFESLGVELGNTPKRILTVGAAVTKMAASLGKLKKITIVKKALEGLNTQWNAASDSVGKLTKKQIALQKATLKSKAVIKLKTAATMIKNMVMKMNPFGKIVAGMALLGAAIGSVIGIIRLFTRGSREFEEGLQNMYAQSGVAVDKIEADMERMEIRCLETWEKVNDAAQLGAETFNLCADEIRADIAYLVGDYGDYELAVESWNNTQLEALDAIANRWNVSTDEIKEALSEQGITMQEWEAQQRDIVRGLSDEWGLSSDEIISQMKSQGISSEEWATKMGQAWDNFQADVGRNVDGIINGFRKIPTEYGKSAEELRAIMEANLATTEEWRGNMVKISEEVSPEMLAWLESKGPEFNSVIEQMLESPAELAAWVDAFDRTTESATTVALDNIDNPTIQNAIQSRLGKTGCAVARDTSIEEGYNQMFERTNSNVKAAARQAGQDMGNEYINGATSVDYSQVTREIVRATETGMNDIRHQFEIGMNHVYRNLQTNLSQIKALFNELPGELETSGSRATLTLRTVSTNLINTMTPLQSKFRTLGEQIIEGLRLGMISRTPALLAEADRIANQITARIQRALRYNSPSRVMRDRVGKSIPEGIAVGISKYSDAAMDSIDKLGKDLINTTFPSIEQMIDLGPNLAMAGITNNSSSIDNRVVNNNSGLFDGATIHWHGEDDVRHTMEKIAWATDCEKARMW